MNSEVLNSWKEIAAYLGRGVRTVQRWERELGLPVRRPRGKDRSAVIALKSDLDKWLQDTPHRLEPHPLQVHEDNLQLRRNTELLKLSTAKLLAQSEKLRAKIAESMALAAALNQKRPALVTLNQKRPAPAKDAVSGDSAGPAAPSQLLLRANGRASNC
jgi:phage terminase Nu1 subunit (DNA packaging protein)